MTELMKHGALCKVESLPYDFEIACADGNILAIERKTPRDFLDSIKDRRLFNQVADMVQKTQWAYVVIEGYFWPSNGGFVETSEHQMTTWNWNALQGALLSIQELGCGVIYNHDFHGSIERLVSRSRNDIKIPQRREPYIFSEKEQVLMSLPDIGSKKAQEYLKIHGDNLALAITNLMAQNNGKEYLPGWGEKSRQNLIDLFGMRLEATLDE